MVYVISELHPFITEINLRNHRNNTGNDFFYDLCVVCEQLHPLINTKIIYYMKVLSFF